MLSERVDVLGDNDGYQCLSSTPNYSYVTKLFMILHHVDLLNHVLLSTIKLVLVHYYDYQQSCFVFSSLFTIVNNTQIIHGKPCDKTTGSGGMKCCY